MLIRSESRQSAQGLVEYALILALVVVLVIIALVLTGGQVGNLYSDIITNICRARLGC